MIPDPTLVGFVPWLDDAMETLDETDRTALLLRYFENKSLRDVGAALGTSDDAAQKQVSRAVERLREFFLYHNARTAIRPRKAGGTRDRFGEIVHTSVRFARRRLLSPE